MDAENLKKLIDCSNSCIDGISRSGLKVELLRPKFINGLDSYVAGDYDFIALKDDFCSILKLIFSICKEKGVHFKLIKRKYRKWQVEFFMDSGLERIVYEFWFSIEMSYFVGDSTKFGVLPASQLFGNPQFSVNKNSILACVFITHLFFKKRDLTTPENTFRSKWFLSEINGDDVFGRAVISLLMELSDDQISARDACRLALLRLAELGFCPASVGLAAEFYRKKSSRISRSIRSRNILPVIGADGSGKGTITDVVLSNNPDLFLKYRYKRLFRRNFFYKKIVKWFSGDRIAKNLADEKISNLILVFSLLNWYFFRLFNFRKKIVMDRFFVDYLGRGIRLGTDFPHPGKIRFYRLFNALIPTTCGLFFFNCKTPTLLDRKKELSEESILFLEDLYCEFIYSKPFDWVVFLSTENEVESVASAFSAEFNGNR
ncbi:MAG: hypothetical protein EA353_08815 [Puniceicoccaceae bacterium]|nr:MAG: hypothetical protein EA353_08815 [Puniceicoccaceae bacterium]